MKKSNSSRAQRDLSGIIVINKPGLLTSNAVLQHVKRLFEARKAGHMGSLDPLATGLLPICFGEATKFSHYGLNADKGYEVTAQFGVETDTGDAQGQVTATASVDALTREHIEQQMAAFLGDYLQIPPMYSALKHQGKKLYELARAGIEVARQPRPITIYDLQLDSFTRPLARFKVRCSKGTYIRTLITDLGDRLKVGAHVTQLHRDYTAGFEDQPIYTLDALALLSQEERDRCLLPADFIVRQLPALLLSAGQVLALYQGKIVQMEGNVCSGEVRLYDDAQQFQGLGEWDLATQELKAKRLIRAKMTNFPN